MSAPTPVSSPSSSSPSSSSSSSSSAEPQRPSSKYNLHNPVPLSAAQEADVKQTYYRRVREHCAAEIKAFAECAVNRTITATWVCRAERLAMNSCMIAHATPEEEDRAREEWFSTYQEQRKARIEERKQVEARRAEVIALMEENERRKARR